MSGKLPVRLELRLLL